jgi:hypothetical protein
VPVALFTSCSPLLMLRLQASGRSVASPTGFMGIAGAAGALLLLNSPSALSPRWA